MKPSDPLQRRLEALQEKGLIRLGEGGKLRGLGLKRKKVKGSPLSDAVLEDRR